MEPDERKRWQAEDTRLRKHMHNGYGNAFDLHQVWRRDYTARRGAFWSVHAYKRAEFIVQQLYKREAWSRANNTPLPPREESLASDDQSDETEEYSDVSLAAFEEPTFLPAADIPVWGSILNRSRDIFGKVRGWAAKSWDTVSQVFH